MPEVLELFLQNLRPEEAEEVSKWVDGTPFVATEMNEVLFDTHSDHHMFNKGG